MARITSWRAAWDARGMVSRWFRWLDIAALAGTCLCLLVAFVFQLTLGDLPCAFCNLQRLGFLIFGAGLFLNMRYGTSPWNYALSAAGALVGSLIGLLQMFVHALPGTPPTGTALLGLHMYFWTYLVLTGAVFYTICALVCFAACPGDRTPRRSTGTAIVSAVFILLVGANLVSTFLENGFHPFKAGGQKHYAMLYDGDVMKP
ncbi:disulfide bond formation protein B [Acetobacter orleanensis]|nr:disulfide bond formation protein B [Acetobacter orleanensis]